MRFYFLLSACALPLSSFAAGVCDSGVYASLKPIATNTVIQSYCSSKYPASTVTVTASNALRKRAKSTTTTTTKRTTTTTKTTTTKPITTTTSNTVLASLTSQASSVAQTFCSCIQTPKTVTVPRTTITTAAKTATSTSSTTTIPVPTTTAAFTTTSDPTTTATTATTSTSRAPNPAPRCFSGFDTGAPNVCSSGCACNTAADGNAGICSPSGMYNNCGLSCNDNLDCPQGQACFGGLYAQNCGGNTCASTGSCTSGVGAGKRDLPALAGIYGRGYGRMQW